MSNTKLIMADPWCRRLVTIGAAFQVFAWSTYALGWLMLQTWAYLDRDYRIQATHANLAMAKVEQQIRLHDATAGYDPAVPSRLTLRYTSSRVAEVRQ